MSRQDTRRFRFLLNEIRGRLDRHIGDFPHIQILALVRELGAESQAIGMNAPLVVYEPGHPKYSVMEYSRPESPRGQYGWRSLYVPVVGEVPWDTSVRWDAGANRATLRALDVLESWLRWCDWSDAATDVERFRPASEVADVFSDRFSGTKPLKTFCEQRGIDMRKPSRQRLEVDLVGVWKAVHEGTDEDNDGIVERYAALRNKRIGGDEK